MYPSTFRSRSRQWKQFFPIYFFLSKATINSFRMPYQPSSNLFGLARNRLSKFGESHISELQNSPLSGNNLSHVESSAPRFPAAVHVTRPQLLPSPRVSKDLVRTQSYRLRKMCQKVLFSLQVYRCEQKRAFRYTIFKRLWRGDEKSFLRSVFFHRQLMTSAFEPYMIHTWCMYPGYPGVRWLRVKTRHFWDFRF